MSHAITINGLSKRYQLGVTHAGSIRELANGLARKILRRSPSADESQPDVDDPSRVQEGSFWALKDVSFDVAKGEVIGIIGKNGAGKSTLLKILSQITRPTEGRAELTGRVASLLEVGTGFHPELTGRENVYLNGTILGMRKREIDRQFNDIADFSGVGKFLDTPVKRYSSGMMVRLGFAVAAHLDPEILIVDEVLAVGDVEFQKRCLGKMQNVAESGKTVLFVSHNLASIRNLTSRTVVLSGGRVAFDGSTEDGIGRYIQENLAQPESDISIANLPRPFSQLDRKLEFTDLRLAGLDATGRLPSDEYFHLYATIHTRETCGDLLFSLTVFAEDKTPIGSTFAIAIHSPAEGDEETFEFSANFPLAPGRYHCAVSLASQRASARHLHDSLNEVLPFEICDPPMGERPWNPGWGAVKLPALSSRRCAELPEALTKS